MRLLLTVLATAAVFAYTAAAASAHFEGYRPQPHGLKPRAELRYANVQVAHASWALSHLRMMVKNGTTLPPGYVRNHRWLLEHAQRLRREALTRIQAATLPAHYAGWLCIHNGAYPGAPHEGWSRYGTYSGPLQMTRPWMGYDLDWGGMSYIDVFRIAERVAAGQGFSYSFMARQWPETYPPCASRF